MIDSSYLKELLTASSPLLRLWLQMTSASYFSFTFAKWKEAETRRYLFVGQCLLEGKHTRMIISTRC